MAIIKGRIEHAREHRPHVIQQGQQVDTTGYTETTLGEYMDDNKTRDLFTDGFTAEDFDDVNWDYEENGLMEYGTFCEASLKAVTARANQLLREALASAQVVSTFRIGDHDTAWLPPSVHRVDTHTARLVAVKKIGDD